MNKFKVGDRVICNDFEFTDVHGNIIKYEPESLLYRVAIDGKTKFYKFFASELKLAEETPQESLCSEKVLYIVLNFNKSSYILFNKKEEVLEFFNSEEAGNYEDYGVYELGKNLKLKETKEVSFE